MPKSSNFWRRIYFSPVSLPAFLLLFLFCFFFSFLKLIKHNIFVFLSEKPIEHRFIISQHFDYNVLKESFDLFQVWNEFNVRSFFIFSNKTVDEKPKLKMSKLKLFAWEWFSLTINFFLSLFLAILCEPVRIT